MNDFFKDEFSTTIHNNLDGQSTFIKKLEEDYIKFIERWKLEYNEYEKIFLCNKKFKKVLQI